MAARRLIIVLLVLFAISIAAAAIAPKRDGGLGSDESTSTTTETTTEESTVPRGGTTDAVIAATAEDPPEVSAGVGDQLALTVATKETTLVEIAELGLLGDSTPEAPAVFDILLREPGELEITDAATDEVIGTIVVGMSGDEAQPRGRTEEKPHTNVETKS